MSGYNIPIESLKRIAHEKRCDKIDELAAACYIVATAMQNESERIRKGGE
jgi:hypothetical protein